ncbi:MAG: hypothetical protein MR469_00935 [Campylobacter sp.]|uniref:hypothetical protein n=1 Tax=Campylobacter sp. TaxID=205 RepID=UPI002AA8F1DE|nr:hypothetical protein [Campylobacter sp.]MCI6694196.1 hypothetical protein [Campylobacter sp.]
MALIIQKQFSLNYEVTGGICRITKAGTAVFNGQSINYGNSVRVTTTNIIEGDIDPETNAPSTRQEILNLKILCQTPLEAGQIVNTLNPLLAKHEPIYFSGGLPSRKQDGSIEVVVEMPKLTKASK